MGKIKPSKISGNDYWIDLVYHNESDLSPIRNPITLIQDQTVGQQNIPVQQGLPIFFKWTVLYNDQMDFYTCLNGLFVIPNSLSNYVVYQPDGVTQIDLSTSHVFNLPSGSGPDPLARETHEIGINFLFQAGQTYYIQYIPPLSGSMGVYIEGD